MLMMHETLVYSARAFDSPRLAHQGWLTKDMIDAVKSKEIFMASMHGSPMKKLLSS